MESRKRLTIKKMLFRGIKRVIFRKCWRINSKILGRLRLSVRNKKKERLINRRKENSPKNNPIKRRILWTEIANYLFLVY